MFGKKKKTLESAPQQTKPKVEPYEIHVMPPKFHKFLGVKKGGGLGKIILILVIVIVVLSGIAFGVFYLINSLQQPQIAPPPVNLNQPPAVNVNESANQNVNEVNENENINENVNLNENVNVNENENVNLNVNENINTNINTNLNVPPPIPTITYTSSADSDNDMLTDLEEEIYETEKRKPDTDSDGFLDGREIINGFNPNAAGSSLLETSGLVNKYTNPVFDYNILHPSVWLAMPADQSLEEIIFQSATGEYVQILMAKNTQELDLVDWFLSQSPLANISQLDRTITKGGYDALISSDRLTYYLVDKEAPETVYIITYNIGNKINVNFLTTFKMMLNSFQLAEQPIEENNQE